MSPRGRLMLMYCPLRCRPSHEGKRVGVSLAAGAGATRGEALASPCAGRPRRGARAARAIHPRRVAWEGAGGRDDPPASACASRTNGGRRRRGVQPTRRPRGKLVEFAKVRPSLFGSALTLPTNLIPLPNLQVEF